MLNFLKRIKQKAESFLKLDGNKKRKLKKMLPGIIGAVAVMAIVLVTVYHSTDGFTTLVDIEHASKVSEKESLTFTAYTLRDEKVLESAYPDGSVYYLAKNGQLLRPGDELARLYAQSIDKSVEAKVEMLDECIDILERSLGDG